MENDKNLQDLMKFIFPVQVPYASEMTSPLDPIVPTNNAPIEDYSAMVEQDKLDKSLTPAAPVQTPPTATKTALKASVSAKDSMSGSSPKAPVEAPKDFRTQLLEEFKAAREANKRALGEAQNKDNDVSLMNALNKSFNQMGTGLANQAGYTKIAGNPLEVSSDMAKQAQVAGASDLDALKQNYGIMADKEGVDLQREKMKMDKEDRAFDRSIKLQQLALEKAKLGKDKAEKEGAGQKELDKQAAKEFQDWTSGGAKIAQSEIGKLKEVVNNLKSGGVTTGGLTGLFPDQLTSNAVLSARSDVQSSVMGSLRSLLGAQFTEKEGERVIKNTWNEADSTENNVARLERLVNDLENKALDKNQKAQFFQQNKGTLKGYETEIKPQSRSEISNTVKVIDPKGNIRLIPSSQLDKALAAGGKLAE